MRRLFLIRRDYQPLFSSWGVCVTANKPVPLAILALLIVGSAFQMGCPFPADAFVTVSGVLKLGEESIDVPEKCVLRMFYADTEGEVGYRNISGAFDTGFVVEPKVNSFYFTVSCENLGVCRTGTFRMGEQPPSHFDLGEIGPDCFNEEMAGGSDDSGDV